MSDVERLPTMATPVEPPGDEQAKADEPAVPPQTLKEVLRLTDAGWAVFRAAALRFPAERMDEHLTEDGWTRKQMLAHVALWHDLTHDRLGTLLATGKPARLEQSVDKINARAARVAVGKTAGEVVKDIEATFSRLRRQIERLDDDVLRRHQSWAAHVIAANTYDHYAEHMPDIYVPEPPEAGGRR